MFTTRKGIVAIALLLLFSGGFSFPEFFDYSARNGDVRLSKQRETHILYGDKTGGGHLHGTGKVCKSEFPASWNEEKIVDTVKMIASNDNLDWSLERNGYHVTQSNIDGTIVRVVLDGEKDDIVTAYPLNVQRNPCPREPANDNIND